MRISRRRFFLVKWRSAVPNSSYLAQVADHAGIPASALGSLAEPAARFVLKRLQLTDIYDWRSTLAAYASLDTKTLQEVLPKQ